MQYRPWVYRQLDKILDRPVSVSKVPTDYRVILTSMFAVLLCMTLFLSCLQLNVFPVFNEEQTQSVRVPSLSDVLYS
jgi:hypothetical protein